MTSIIRPHSPLALAPSRGDFDVIEFNFGKGERSCKRIGLQSYEPRCQMKC